jgi:hypothetical protein
MNLSSIPGSRSRELLAFIGRARHTVDRRIADAMTTVLLLVDPAAVPLLKFLAAQAAYVDSHLISRLYESATGRGRVSLASAPVARYLPAKEFKRVWVDALGRARSVHEKEGLGVSLAGHLARNEGIAAGYQGYVWRHFVRARERNLRVRGFELLGYANRLTPRVAAQFRRGLAARSELVRIAALFGLSVLGRRLGRFASAEPAAVKQLEVIVLELAAGGGAEDVRLGARNCLAALRSSGARGLRPRSAHRRDGPRDEPPPPRR